MKINSPQKLLFLLGLLVGIVVLVIAFQPENATKHLPLTISPLSTEPSIPSKSMYFNTFIGSQDVRYIMTHNNLLFGVTQDEIIDLQTKKTTFNLQGVQVLSINAGATLIKEGDNVPAKILTPPFSINSSRQITSNFKSPMINSLGSAILDCTESPQALINDGLIKSKIQVDSPSCFWTSNDVIVIQSKNQTYLWDIKANTKTFIEIDDGEKAIYATENTLFTNKNGVLGIRGVDSVRGVPFHENSTLHVVYLDQEGGAAIIFEVVQEGETSRGYVYELKIVNGTPSRATIIGSTHPVPEGIDALYRPLYLSKNAIMIIRTITGKYWFTSLIQSKLPYQNSSGPELHEPAGMIFSEDPNDLQSSSFSE